MRTRRTFKPEFKAKVVLECISGEKSVSEACWEYQLSSVSVSKWRNEFIENSAAIFEKNHKGAESQDQIANLDLWVMLAVAALVVLLVGLFYKDFLAISFDETFARVRNLPVDALYLMMIAMIGLTVVVAMRVVGLIMIIALLTIPPAIANLFLKSMWKIMLIAMGLSVLFTVTGLLISYYFNITSGAMIILVAATTYLIAFLARALYQKCRQ